MILEKESLFLKSFTKEGVYMFKLSKKTVLSAALVGLILLTSTSAMAGENWRENHPRRAEVNNRLENQNQRIHQEVKEGDMSRQQAAQLHQEDRQIRQEERNMASQNGGHITQQEQRTLNQQENGVSRQIGQ